MNIPVTFLQQDGSDHFAVPVRVVSIAPVADVVADSEADSAPVSLGVLVRDGLSGLVHRSLSVALPHRRFRRRQRARLRLAIS
jgi:hypothetical protein